MMVKHLYHWQLPQLDQCNFYQSSERQQEKVYRSLPTGEHQVGGEVFKFFNSVEQSEAKLSDNYDISNSLYTVAPVPFNSCELFSLCKGNVFYCMFANIFPPSDDIKELFHYCIWYNVPNPSSFRCRRKKYSFTTASDTMSQIHPPSDVVEKSTPLLLHRIQFFPHPSSFRCTVVDKSAPSLLHLIQCQCHTSFILRR